jgi:hypothetical protein
MGGLLTGLPALCANGLLSGLDKHLHLPKGFYSCLHILLTLAFMALGRIRRPEQLRHIPPGEFGKSLGLDRVPEVRTLRQKIGLLAAGGNTKAWLQDLSKSSMEQDPEEAGYLYIDGHVRVYSGSAANLPRRFVSREKLCLRGTTDYWVNDAIGRPFFVVSKAVTDGLADTLINDIVPDLCASVPQHPAKVSSTPTPCYTALSSSSTVKEPPTVCCPNCGSSALRALPTARTSKTNGPRLSSLNKTCQAQAVAARA